MENNDGPARAQLDLQFTHTGRTGTIQMLVKWPDGSFTDTFNVLNDVARKRFTKSLRNRCPSLDDADVERQLDRIAEQIACPSGPDNSDGDPSGDSDNKIMIAIGRDPAQVELFYMGERHDSDAFVRVRVDDHFEVWPLKSRAFANWLRQKFYERMDRSPSSQGFTDAINTLTSIALYEGKSVPVFLRIASFENSVVLDLCNEAWSAVIIDAKGWRVVPSSEVPVRFTRKRGMLPLPVPVRGGSITELRPFVNITSQSLWVLYTCSLASFFRPRGPYIVLVASGEQGSAKSTLVKKTRALIDPSTAPARRLSRDDRDLMIAAKNAFLQVFDNVSTITPAISDALCSLATGGGLSTRQLFTDDEEVLFDAMRPVMLNGIEDVATRADLLDRSVILHLQPIPESDRREERDLDADFERARPRILGALLDATSTALARLDSVVLVRRPRMADFARWCAAVETGFGFAPGAFMDAYRMNRRDAVSIVLESSVVGGPVQALVHARGQWQGTASDLLQLMNSLFPDERARHRLDWPKTPRTMADALRRIAPALRSIGIEVIQGERKTDRQRTRLITLRKESESPQDRSADDVDDVDDVVAESTDPEHSDPVAESPVSPTSRGSKPATTSSASSVPSATPLESDGLPYADPLRDDARAAPGPDRDGRMWTELFRDRGWDDV